MDENNAQQPTSAKPEVTHLAVDPNHPVAEQAPIQPQAPMGSNPHQFTQPKKSKLPLVGGILAGAMLLILGSGYYALAYLPNTPQNVWRRGMASVGVGLDELGGGEALFTSEATEFDGEINVTKPTVFSSTLTGTTTVSGTGELSFDATWDTYNPELDLYYSFLEDSYPKFFFRFDGVSEIIDDAYGPGAFSEISGGQQTEGIWWLVDLEELVDRGFLSQADLEEVLASADTDTQASTEDYVKVTQAVIEASNQYIFTSEEADMVLQRTEDLGKEDYEGQESQKYAVEINKDNLKKYLKQVRDNIDETGVVQKYSPETSLKDEITDADIDDGVDEADFSEVKIEAWVGLNNKVLRNLRFTPVDDDSGYVDLSLLLDEANLDKIPLRMRIAGDDEEAVGKVDINWIVDTVANSAEISVDADIDYKNDFSDDLKMDARFSFRGLAEAPALQVPEPSQSFVEFVLKTAEQIEDVLGITTDNL